MFTKIVFFLFCISSAELAVFDIEQLERIQGRYVKGGFLHSKQNPGYRTKAGNGNPVEEIDFVQRLDHFNPQDTRTWTQQAQVNAQFYSNETRGPVFLMLGGEGPIDADIMLTEQGWDFAQQMQRFKALAFQLEHRYYGFSWPTNNMTLENLQYLSSRQALADMADFIQAMNKQYDLNSDNKWIVFGGSYSGALAAWARIKYPHLIHGAIASSAVVNVGLDNHGYLDVISRDILEADPACYSLIKDAMEQLEDLLDTPFGRAQIQKDFNFCTPFTSADSDDVRYFISQLNDIWMGVGQSGGLEEAKVVCRQLLEKTGKTPYDRYAAFSNIDRNLELPCRNVSYQSFVDLVRNEESDGWLAALRPWYYQKCTEFGYFKTTNGKDNIFGSTLTIEFMQKICSDAFDSSFTLDFTKNAITETREYYGGTAIQTPRIFFLNGKFDPWHALGVLSSTTIQRPSYVIQDGIHCSNMYQATVTDNAAIKVAKRLITIHLLDWIKS
jgi:hypothetical protein